MSKVRRNDHSRSMISVYVMRATSEKKKHINWTDRDRMLRDLCDQFRRSDGRYDVVVPGSGGKDSVMAAHLLKYEYGMNPILVTWPPAIYTDIGSYNFNRWLETGFANYTYHQNRRVHRILTQQAYINLCHPFQPFILGQKNLAPKMSVLLDIPLVIFGENEAEYGNAIADNEKPTRDPKYYSADGRIEDLFLWRGQCEGANGALQIHYSRLRSLPTHRP